MDIYKPLRPRATPRHYLRVSRLGVVAFGLVLALTAMACRHAGNVLWLAFQIISVTGGSMLGVFLVGLLTRGGSSRGNIAAMVLNALAMAALLLLSSFGPHGLMEFLHVPRLLELLHLARLLGPGSYPTAGEGPIVPLAWSWLIVVGTANTFLLAIVLGKLLPDRRR
jgi:Na+/proline symporter